MDSNNSQRALPPPSSVQSDICTRQHTHSTECHNTTPTRGFAWMFTPYHHFNVSSGASYAEREKCARLNDMRARFGEGITPEQSEKLHTATIKLSQSTVMSYTQALNHIVALFSVRAGVIEDTDILYNSFRSAYQYQAQWVGDVGSMYERNNYDHWWIGLERQCYNSERTPGRNNQREPRKRGSYSYRRVPTSTTAKQESYWRHTRTR